MTRTPPLLRRLEMRRAHRRHRRHLHDQAERLVASMPIPRPFDLDVFIANIAQARGRRIHLIPMPDHITHGSGICGLWVKRHHDDLIVHLDSTSAFHRQQIILHELVHLWADDAAGLDEEQAAALAHGMPTKLLERLLAAGRISARRSYYADDVEMRTESAAALIHGRAYAGETLDDAVTRHLAADFGATPRLLKEAV